MNFIIIGIQTLISLLLGMVGCLAYGWGFFEPYLTSYMHLSNSSVTTSTLHCYLFLGYLGELIGAFTFNSIVKLLGYKEIICLSMLLCGITMTIGYFSLNLVTLFIIVVVNGMQETYRSIILPFIMMSIMPNNIGFANSIANSGTGIATLYWSEMAAKIINPNNEAPTVPVMEGNTPVKYFDEEVVDSSNLFMLYNTRLRTCRSNF